MAPSPLALRAQTAFFVFVLFFGMLSAADISITFDKFNGQAYGMPDVSVLTVAKSGTSDESYTAVPIDARERSRLYTEFSLEPKFPVESKALAKTDAKQVIIIVRLKTQGTEIRYQARRGLEGGLKLKFPQDFKQEEAFYPLTILPEKAMYSGSGRTAVFGWVHTFKKTPKILIKIERQLLSAGDAAFKQVAGASEKIVPDGDIAVYRVQESETDVPGTKKNTLYRSTTAPTEVIPKLTPQGGVVSGIQWNGRQEMQKIKVGESTYVANGEYYAVFQVYPAVAGKEGAYEGKPKEFSAGPIYVNDRPLETGKYSIELSKDSKQKAKLELRDYIVEITSYNADGALLRLTERLDETRTGAVYENTQIANSFRYSQKYPDRDTPLQSGPTKPKDFPGVFSILKKGNYVMLTLRETTSIYTPTKPEVTPEKKPAPAKQSGGKDEGQTPPKQTESATEKGVEVTIYTRAESALKTAGNPNAIFVNLQETTKRYGVRFYANIDLQKEGQGKQRIRTNIVIGAGQSQIIPINSNPAAGTYTVTVSVIPTTSVSTPVETSRTIEIKPGSSAAAPAASAPGRTTLGQSCQGKLFDFLIKKVYTAAAYRSGREPIDFIVTPARQKGVCKTACGTGEMTTANSAGTCAGGVCCSPSGGVNLEYLPQVNKIDPARVGYCDGRVAQTSQSACEGVQNNPYCIWEEKDSCVPSQAGYRLIQSEVERWMRENNVNRLPTGTDGRADAIFDFGIQDAARKHCAQLNGNSLCTTGRKFDQTIRYIDTSGGEKTLGQIFDPVSICEVKASGRCFSKVVGPYSLPIPNK